MFRTALVLPLFMASFTGANHAALFARQEFCGQGLEYCGSFCIPNSYTCCPNEMVGCRPGTYCAGLGTDGKPQCCFDKDNCDSSGGINLLPGGTITSLFTSFSTTVDDSTSTTTIVDGSTYTATGDVTSSLTSASTSTSTSTSVLTSTSTSASVGTSSSLSTPPTLPSSHASTPSSSVTTGSSTASSSPPAFTGGADARAQSVVGWLLAIALPIFAL